MTTATVKREGRRIAGQLVTADTDRRAAVLRAVPRAVATEAERLLAAEDAHRARTGEPSSRALCFHTAEHCGATDAVPCSADRRAR